MSADFRPRFTSWPGREMEAAIRQVAIFVPKDAPFDGDDWAESVLGNVIAPLVNAESAPTWFWFTRYARPRSDHEGMTVIPSSFEIDGLVRSVRFRYAVPANGVEAFEQRTRESIDAVGARGVDISEYDWLGDLGAERFVGTAATARRRERAQRVADFLWSLSRLTLDCLIGPDEVGRYRFEESLSKSNPHGSPFESLHHLFCNITAVPTSVLINGDQVGTHWTPPPSTEPTQQRRVWF